MGTNYYLHVGCCSACGKAKKVMHIGKSSGGWCFSLHVEPESGINDLADWELMWSEPGSKIVDEDGDELSQSEMLCEISERSWRSRSEKPLAYENWQAFHDANSSEPGPNNLLRHRISKGHCVKHGDGTWDCIIGEFS